MQNNEAIVVPNVVPKLPSKKSKFILSTVLNYQIKWQQ
jgi:hypothetical protein